MVCCPKYFSTEYSDMSHWQVSGCTQSAYHWSRILRVFLSGCVHYYVRTAQHSNSSAGSSPISLLKNLANRLLYGASRAISGHSLRYGWIRPQIDKSCWTHWAQVGCLLGWQAKETNRRIALPQCLRCWLAEAFDGGRPLIESSTVFFFNKLKIFRVL